VEQSASVATIDDVVIGGFVTVMVDRADKPGEIGMIAVDPAMQRSGVGRALTNYALDQIRAAGCRVAVVHTGGDPGHGPARGLYESCGFTTFPSVDHYRLL
jgi:ribosomal protein S18 acetylase RimI-like enzyme